MIDAEVLIADRQHARLPSDLDHVRSVALGMHNRLVSGHLVLANVDLGHDVGAGRSGLNLVLLWKLVAALIADSRRQIQQRHTLRTFLHAWRVLAVALTRWRGRLNVRHWPVGFDVSHVIQH